ncbi:MAG: peptide chain release factor N(5)-glutamine methyltransferase [Paludibacteraceae bacterium]|nr:peptide chain release factor N(5)-glutamine methyltransferase [Paludibacteraceae bacterium]
MQQFLKDLQTSLKGEYSESEIHVLGMLILEKLTGFSRIWLLIHKELKLNDEQNIIASQYLERLKNHEPIQYILGETEFYGLKFKVNPSVLIPRPETEELVEWVKPPHPPKGGFLSGTPTLLDVGTGSGCIAVALKKKFPSANVSAMDISPEALALAKENAALNEVNIEFIQDDILHPAATDRKWDVIVSNPPYIPASEQRYLHKNVTDFEPHLALFVQDNDPLIFYRKIAEFALSHLSAGGRLYVEIHQSLGRQCCQLLESMGFQSVELRKDLSGNDRMISSFASG